MGAVSAIGDGAEVYNVAHVSLGERCVVSQRSYLCTASHDFRSAGFELIAAPISVERYAWVAAGAFVGPGVTLGEGAVAGAMTVLTRSVPAWTVVAGNPARALSTRPADVGPRTYPGEH